MRRRDTQRSERWGEPSGLWLLGFWFFEEPHSVFGWDDPARVS